MTMMVMMRTTTMLMTTIIAIDSQVGAACGRIHPVGSGPMVWYQSFEYAIGHWLQKAAEHKLGCVLCSPGCFSLFRGSALMDDKVRFFSRLEGKALGIYGQRFEVYESELDKSFVLWRSLFHRSDDEVG